MSLALTPSGSLPSTSRAHVLRLALDQSLRRQHVLDLGGADAVGERAEGAVGRRVAVAANQRDAGQGEGLLRPDHVDDALTLVELVEIFQPEQLGVLRQIRDLGRAFGVGIGRVTIGGRHVVVDDAERLLGRAHLAAGQAQALERLRTGDLVHEMAVDVDQAGAIGLLVHQMVFPDLVVEGTRLRHGSCPIGPVRMMGSCRPCLMLQFREGKRRADVTCGLAEDARARATATLRTALAASSPSANQSARRRTEYQEALIALSSRPLPRPLRRDGPAAR